MTTIVKPAPAIERAGVMGLGAPPRESAVMAFVRRYPVAVRLIAAQALVLAITAPLYSRYGLHVDWSTAGPLVAGYALLLAVAMYTRRCATHPGKAIYPEVVVATALLLLLTNIVAPAQYVALALHRPLIDPWLARADAAIGIHVPVLAAWTGQHPSVRLALTICYASLMPQFLLPIALAGLWFRNRERLWEYVFHFHFCLLATLATLALAPAASPSLYYGFRSLDPVEATAQIAALRDGTLHVISFSHLQGLISMPSFHAAGGLMVAWAFREYRRISAVLVPLNVGLIAATFMTGTHYAVDAIAAFALMAVSVWIYRRRVAPLLRLA